jgi:hypothetical protein
MAASPPPRPPRAGLPDAPTPLVAIAMGRRRAIWTTNAIVNQDDRRSSKAATLCALSALLLGGRRGPRGSH